MNGLRGDEERHLPSGMSVMLLRINCITCLEDVSYRGQFAGKKKGK